MSTSSGPSAVQAVHEVSFDVGRGEVVGVVGESGSGKTTVGTSLLGYSRAELIGKPLSAIPFLSPQLERGND